MFHVEQMPAGGHRKPLFFQDFRRGGASSSATTIFFGGACAIVTVRKRFVKSFLRVCPKLFLCARVFVGLDPVPNPGIIS